MEVYEEAGIFPVLGEEYYFIMNDILCWSRKGWKGYFTVDKLEHDEKIMEDIEHHVFCAQSTLNPDGKKV